MIKWVKGGNAVFLQRFNELCLIYDKSARIQVLTAWCVWSVSARYIERVGERLEQFLDFKKHDG
jgi:hypothetical protein